MNNKLPKVSAILLHIIKENISKSDKVLEVGAASAHISSVLKQNGYNISGIEIRRACVADTKEKLKKLHIDFDLQCGNVINLKRRFDVLWCSGLIQCWTNAQKEKFIAHFARLAPKGIFFVPERSEYLPPVPPPPPPFRQKVSDSGRGLRRISNRRYSIYLIAPL